MASLELPARSGPLLFAAHDHPQRHRRVRSLIVSSAFEARQHLVQALEALAVDVIACSGCGQAEQVLSRQGFEIVFCDEHLPDGSYHDLIHANHWDGRIPRIVVTTTGGDWDLYFEALGKGAFDVIRCPGYSTDVEMAVVRALHEEEQGDKRSPQ
jgi:DNA-binding NtrC family response regulator